MIVPRMLPAVARRVVVALVVAGAAAAAGGSVTFRRERTGTRTFDLNRDGVAHYGLIPDLLADMERTRAGRRALPLLFNSAEAYLETWQRALAHR